MLTTLLYKDKKFIIDEEGERAFQILKQALIEALIQQRPNWDIPFEIMCNALDYVGAGFGVVGGQEANCCMLREQDTCQSLDTVHDDGEGGTSSSLRIRQVPDLHLKE